MLYVRVLVLSCYAPPCTCVNLSHAMVDRVVVTVTVPSMNLFATLTHTNTHTHTHTHTHTEGEKEPGPERELFHRQPWGMVRTMRNVRKQLPRALLAKAPRGRSLQQHVEILAREAWSGTILSDVPHPAFVGPLREERSLVLQPAESDMHHDE